MIARSNSPRRGFTLLELVLSITIGMLILVGLYFALDVHLNATSAGRTQVQQSAVARNVLRQFTIDITHNVASLDQPLPTPKTTTTTATTGSTTTGSTTTDPTTGAATDTTTTVLSSRYPFNLGVQGSSDTLTLYISKVPLSIKQAGNNNLPGTDDVASDSDLRRVTYWMTAAGLARQEVIAVTSDDELGNLPPGIPDEEKFVIAGEIVAVQFQYFDGTTWQDSWDGSVLAADGVSVTGPPFAIAMTLTIGRVDGTATESDDPESRTYRHVVQIPTATQRALPPTGN